MTDRINLKSGIEALTSDVEMIFNDI